MHGRIEASFAESPAVNRRRQRVADHAGEVVSTVLIACLIASLLASTVAAAAVFNRLQFGPRVGEILRFRPGGYIPADWGIPAERLSDHRICLLEPAVLSAERGSIVVEQRRSDGWYFHAHWAGGRTSAGANDCGSSADLQLGLTAMQALVNAAGGSVGAHWHFVGF